MQDLTFSPEESNELLKKIIGSDLSDEQLQMIYDKTEGWIAGLQLSALSLANRPDINDFLEKLSASHRYVLHFLSEEILSGQPPDLLDFLMKTSIPDRLSAQLCEALTGRSDSARPVVAWP